MKARGRKRKEGRRQKKEKKKERWSEKGGKREEWRKSEVGLGLEEERKRR